MVNESTLPTLFRAISNFEIEADLKTLHKPLMESLQILVAKFLQSVATPVETHCFEQDIEKTVREFARSVVQWCYGALETEDIQDMPAAINYRDHSYRRMRDKTNHSQILTLFGIMYSDCHISVFGDNFISTSWGLLVVANCGKLVVCHS